MRVINLGQHRDLLKSWDEVQGHLRRGKARGFALMLIDQDGSEAVYLGGSCKSNPEEAARAGLQISLEVVKLDRCSGY